MISAKVIADSVNAFGNRIVTMVLTYPRIIHSEFMTHRSFSRNAASSRAVPFNKLVESVQSNPFIPIAWQKNHSGMQGTEYIDKEERGNFYLDNGLVWKDEVFFSKYFARQRYIIGKDSSADLVSKLSAVEKQWIVARDAAIKEAELLFSIGVTKQIVNRLLEPFQWYTTIVTATEWENFFALRCPKYGLFYEQIPMEFRSKKDLLKFANQVEAPEFKNSYNKLTDLEWLQCNKGQAEIHMMALAEAMWDAYQESVPKPLKAGEWHIPFGDDIHEGGVKGQYHKLTKPTKDQLNEIRVKIATARCARVSYTVVGEEGKAHDYKKDIELHDRLAKSGHWSPFEHCAQAREQFVYGADVDNLDKCGWSGNFRGFIQYRKTFANENIEVKN